MASQVWSGISGLVREPNRDVATATRHPLIATVAPVAPQCVRSEPLVEGIGARDGEDRVEVQRLVNEIGIGAWLRRIAGGAATSSLLTPTVAGGRT